MKTQTPCNKCLGVQPICGHLPDNYKDMPEADLEAMLRECRRVVFDIPAAGDAIVRLKEALAPHWEKRARRQDVNCKHWMYSAE